MLLIKKLQLGEDFFTPLRWIPHKMEGAISASVVCANKHRGTLSDHDIASDGMITPSLQCSECDWHEIVKLKDWNG